MRPSDCSIKLLISPSLVLLHGALPRQLLFLCARIVVAMSVHNVTIDDADTSGIIFYRSSRLSGWADQTCPSCYAKPIDLTQVFDGTWHDTTHLDNKGDSNDLAADFLFTGKALLILHIKLAHFKLQALLSMCMGYK